MICAFGWILFLAAATCAAATPLQLRSVSFDFSSEKVRGVNLGGWLLLEPWIRPSLWNQWASNTASGPVDEYHYCETLGKTEAQARLKAHWDSWYTLKDFQDVKAAGLNTVRIPIGYWAFQPNDGDPYVTGQETYLDKAIDWARAVGLKVWIDLHGAPGSQNGFDNSGLRDHVGWEQGNTVQQTLNVLKIIAQKYGKQQDVVVAIELLNEPLGPQLDMAIVKQFYNDGWGTIRDTSDTFVVVHEAFQGVTYWNDILSGGGLNVIVDIHHYQVFSQAEVSRDVTAQIATACGSGAATIFGSNKYVVVGEFSGAMTDCAKWLNGWNRGARYDGSFQSSQSYGSCSGKGEIAGMSAADRVDLRKYIEAQLDTFEKVNGWMFWCWKTEGENGSDDWNLSALIASGLFPQPLTEREYPGQCD